MKTKKKCCVFTFVKNEKVFLPIWLKYYSKYFDKEDIYVLNHDSDDGSIEDCLKSYAFNLITLHHEYYDDIWKIKIARQKQIELLQSYDFVLYADADEIIIPDPKYYRDLKEYIAKCELDRVICTCYELLHVRKKEPPINLNRPILEQRNYWYLNNFYDKPLLSRKPLAWVPGFHSAADNSCFKDKDENLWLIHLHKFDFDLCYDKHKKIYSMKWSNECIKNNLGWQFRIASLREFTNYFDTRHPDGSKLVINGWGILIIAITHSLKVWIKTRIFKRKSVILWRQWTRDRYTPVTKISRILKRSKII